MILLRIDLKLLLDLLFDLLRLLGLFDFGGGTCGGRRGGADEAAAGQTGPAREQARDQTDGKRALSRGSHHRCSLGQNAPA